MSLPPPLHSMQPAVYEHSGTACWHRHGNPCLERKLKEDRTGLLWAARTSCQTWGRPDTHPSETFGMASMIFAVAERDSALVPASSAATAASPLAAGAAATAPGRMAPGSGRFMSSSTAYSSRICENVKKLMLSMSCRGNKIEEQD